MPIELYRAYGFDFALLGCCMVSFKDLLTVQDKIITSREIISTDDNVQIFHSISVFLTQYNR